VSVPPLDVKSDRDPRSTGPPPNSRTEQQERYVTPPFQYAQPRGVSHRIAEQAPDTPAEPVPDINTRAA
jgi:hypothetical protein